MAFGWSSKDKHPNSGHPFREPQTPTTQEIDPRVKKAIDDGESVFKQKQQADIDKLEKWVMDEADESSVFALIRSRSASGNREAVLNAPCVLGWSTSQSNTYAANLLRKISGIAVEIINGYIDVSW